jgi:hypothetical protein
MQKTPLRTKSDALSLSHAVRSSERKLPFGHTWKTLEAEEQRILKADLSKRKVW